MVKLLHVIFSTNRIPYLERTFSSLNKLNFQGIQVHKLFIDDYPKGRDDKFIANLAARNGFNEVILHEKNMGITSTWQQLFEIARERDYNYIFHQEDDVEVLQEIKLLDVVAALQSNSNLSQIQLKRNKWYEWETEDFSINPTDTPINDFYIEKGSPYFWMLMSLYPSWISKIDFYKETGSCPSEWIIAQYLLEKYNLTAGILKDTNGRNLVHHFGESSKGKRVNQDEPGWDRFKHFDPEKEYCSKTGKEIK